MIPIIILLAFFIHLVIKAQINISRFNAEPATPVVGNMDGVPISIPRVFARFVEHVQTHTC